MTFHRLVQANAGSLILQLGKHDGDGVRESLLGAVTNDPADLRLAPAHRQSA